MPNTQEIEVWALQRAEQIVLSEGMKLMEAAQWLDRKKTMKASAQLRVAICQSLVEALAKTELPKPRETEDRFDQELDSRTSIIDQTIKNAAKPPESNGLAGRLPPLMMFKVSASG